MINKQKKKAISLIVLIITIIIVVVLATAVILSIANNNPIENAKEAKFLNDIKTIEEDLNVYASKKKSDKYNYDINDLDLSGEEMVKELPSTKNYVDKIEIIDGKVVLIADRATNNEIEWATENNIQITKGKNFLKERGMIFSNIGINKSEITKIIFENSTSNAPKNTYDLSEEGNNSIVGWVDGTEVHIASDGEIYANKNSGYMFDGMNKLTEIQNLNLLNTSKTTDMSYMFRNCSALTSLDVSHFDTSNVTDMRLMFHYCIELINLDVSHFDTSNVTSMFSMFSYCQKLTNLDVSDFNTSNVGSMRQMFENCIELTNLDVSSFNTSKVTSLYRTFYNCSSVTDLDVSHFDTSNVTTMFETFFNCRSLTDLDLSNFNTSNVTDMYEMFCNCVAISSLDLSSFDTSKVSNMNSMFRECSNLKIIYVGNTFFVDAVTNSNDMFYNCKALVGGSGTTYNSSKIDVEYARVDNPPDEKGYFTLKTN